MWKCGLSHRFRVGFSQGGVNWLGAEELRNLFDSMDADGSGKLNLGAMICTNTKHDETGDVLPPTLVRRAAMHSYQADGSGRTRPAFL